MRILVEIEEFQGYPDDVKLLLAIALYQVTPYSWSKIAEVLGFSPVILWERLKTFKIPVHKYGKRETQSEIEAARHL